MRWRVLLLLSLVWSLPQAVLAQEGVGVSVTVINTDFSRSWATLQEQPAGDYLVTIHGENSGGVTSKDAVLSLVLSSGWSYEGTQGDAGVVSSGDKPYGQVIEWQLKPLATGQAIDVQANVHSPGDAPSTPLLVSLSSAYSQPVYVELTPAVKTEEKNSLWSSWIRSSSAYISLTAHEFWYRLSTEIRLGLGKK